MRGDRKLHLCNTEGYDRVFRNAFGRLKVLLG